MNPKYPQVRVQLVGEDGNAFAILGRVTGAMRRAGLAETERNAFTKEATSGDYDNLLRTVLAWVSVDGLGDESDDESDDYYNDSDYDDDESDDERGPQACYECSDPYAVGGCPSCGASHP
jgi:hypothetical protein